MKGSHETYEAQRDAFRLLCIDFAPPHKRDEIGSSAAQEFDLLVESLIFPQIAVHEGMLLVRTRSVWILHEGQVRRLGEYLIEVGKCYFSAHNLTRTINGYHHPHINVAGAFCMSSGHAEIMQMLKDGELASAIRAIESVLWQIGPGSQYPSANINNWPVESEIKEKRDA